MKPSLFGTLVIALFSGLFLFTSCEKSGGLDDDLQEEFEGPNNTAYGSTFNLSINGEDWPVKSYHVGPAFQSIATLSNGKTEGISCWYVIAYDQTIEERNTASDIDSLVLYFVMPFENDTGAAPDILKGSFPLLDAYGSQELHIEYKGDQVFRPDFSSSEPVGEINVTELFDTDNSRFGHKVAADFSMTLFPIGSTSPSSKIEVQGAFHVADGEWNLP